MTIQTILSARACWTATTRWPPPTGSASSAAGVLAVNVIASPGAGKTSLIIRTLDALRGRPPSA